MFSAMFNIDEVSIKRVVSVGGWCPKAFGVEGIRLVVSCVVMKKFSNAQTSGVFVTVCTNFSPVDVSGEGTEAESSGEELSFVISEGDV